MDGQPTKVGDLLAAILARHGYAQTTARKELEDAWAAVASESVQSHTRVGSIRRGTLEILVDNPVLLSRLESFEKTRLLAGLKERVRHNQVERLKFRRL